MTNEDAGRPMPDDRFRAGQTGDQGRPICGAKGRSGRPCRKPPAKGRTRCRMHGGATPVGPASSNWKHGRHSRYVSGDLGDAYERAMADPDILSLAAELALVDSRVAALLAALDEGGSPDALARGLTSALDRFDAAVARRDQDAANDALDAVRRFANRASRTRATWGELVALVEARRKLAETERRRIEAAQATITVGELATIVSVLLADARAVFQEPTPTYTRLVAVWRDRLGPAAGMIAGVGPKGD